MYESEMITLLTRVQGGDLVCDKVFSVGVGVNLGTVGASLRDNTVHLETLPLTRRCMVEPFLRLIVN